MPLVSEQCIGLAVRNIEMALRVSDKPDMASGYWKMAEAWMRSAARAMKDGR